MTLGHFIHLVLGLFIGLLPTFVSLINKKLDSLDKTDPVDSAILREAIRNLSDKKPIMKQNETVVPMQEVIIQAVEDVAEVIEKDLTKA